MNEATALQVQETPRALRSIGEIIADLSKPLDPKHLKTRTQGKAELTYIEWHTAVKYLDLFAPGWNYHVPSVQLVGNLVTVVASISIPCAEGSVTREATGCEESDAKGYGDALSNSEAMALKRAASKFGLGLYLYDKDGKAAPEARQQQGRREAEAARDPHAKTLNDLVSPKQLWMIRNMAREQGVDPDQMAQDLLKCRLEEVSKKSASVIIDKLKANQGQAAIEDKAIEMESQRRQSQAEKLRPVAKPAENGPSRKAVFNRKHSPEIAKRFDAIVTRLCGSHHIKGDELLRETNSVLHDAGLPQVKTRYELDDNGAAMVCQIFEKWADRLDRELAIDGRAS